MLVGRAPFRCFGAFRARRCRAYTSRDPLRGFAQGRSIGNPLRAPSTRIPAPTTPSAPFSPVWRGDIPLAVASQGSPGGCGALAAARRRLFRPTLAGERACLSQTGNVGDTPNARRPENPPPSRRGGFRHLCNEMDLDDPSASGDCAGRVPRSPKARAAGSHTNRDGVRSTRAILAVSGGVGLAEPTVSSCRGLAGDQVSHLERKQQQKTEENGCRSQDACQEPLSRLGHW